MSNKALKSEFIKSIENELRRLSPQLTIPITSSDPLEQAVYIIKVAMDNLLDEKKALEQEFVKISHEPNQFSSQESIESSQNRSKLANTQKELAKIESLLKAREKRLEARENDLECQEQRLTQDRHLIEEEKIALATKTRELASKTRNFQEKEREFSHSYENFLNEKNAYNRLKEQSRCCHEISESSNSRIPSTLRSQESMKVGLEKLKSDSKELEEKKLGLKLQQEALKKAAEELEMQRRLLDEERSRFHASISPQKNKNKGLNILDTLIEGGNVKEVIDLLYSQIEVYNYEVSIRENKLIEREKQVQSDQQRVSETYAEIVNIKESLLSAKSEITNSSKSLLKEIEGLYSKAKELLNSFDLRLSEVEVLTSRVTQSVLLLGENHIPKIQEPVAGPKRTPSEITECSEEKSSDDLIKVLEYKLKAVQKKEKDIEIESNRQKKCAEELKESKEKVSILRGLLEEEKEKLKVQAYQLEMKMKTLSNKESDVIRFRDELEKRANLLSIKEKQAELKDLQRTKTDIILNRPRP